MSSNHEVRRTIAVALFCVTFGGACVDLIPSPEVRHDIKDIKWKRDAQKWAGTYTFAECATARAPEGAPAACWRYTIAVDRDADALVTVQGPEAPPRAKGQARVHVENKLDIVFTSYPDDGVDVSAMGIHAFEPLRGRFTPGQHIAFLTHDPSGRACLTFDGMESKLGTKTLCAAP